MSNPYELVTIPAPAGPIRGAFAHPAKGTSAPAVVLLQEAFGFTSQLLGVGERLVEEGFAVVVPDLYSRDPRRRDLADEDVALGFPIFRATDRALALSLAPPERRDVARKVVEWLEQRDSTHYLDDASAAVDWIRGRTGVWSDRVAALGFCMGGGLVGQLAVNEAPLAAGVIFYGQVPSPEQVPKIRIPLHGHYAEKDPSITPKIPAFAEALAAQGIPFDWTVHEGTLHGFFNESRPAYDVVAASKSWASTLAFLKSRLQGLRLATSGGYASENEE